MAQEQADRVCEKEDSVNCLHCGLPYHEGFDHQCKRYRPAVGEKWDPAGLFNEGREMMTTPNTFYEMAAKKDLAVWSRLMHENARVRRFAESLKQGTTVGEVMEMENGDAKPKVRR